MMLPMRGIEEGFTGGDESRPAMELQAAASMAAGGYGVIPAGVGLNRIR